MPACRNTPADAAASRNHTTARPCCSAATEISVFVVNPDVSGKLEMASAPMMPHTVVSGMVRKSPPRSEQRVRPVR